MRRIMTISSISFQGEKKQSQRERKFMLCFLGGVLTWKYDVINNEVIVYSLEYDVINYEVIDLNDVGW